MIFKIILGLFFLINTVESFGDYDVSKESDQQEYTIKEKPDTQKVLWSFVNIVKRVKDRTVCVMAVQTSSEEEDELAKRFANTPLEEFFKNFLDKDNKAKRIHVAGSGFFIKVDKNVAYIVTNNHIVENVTNAKILLNDKTEIPAVIHGTDSRSDLAVLKIDMQKIPESKRHMIQAMEWGDSDTKEVGDWVLAIGNPFGLGNTVTHGIISAKSRDLSIRGSNAFNDDFIQHSAQINMGNSGGCLIDTDGRVIGINTLILTPAGGNVGIGFAIPSNIAKNVIDQLIEKQKIQRGALGIQVQDFTSEMAESLGLKYKSGAVIASVDPKGPANKVKLKVGDVIVKFDNTEVTGASKLSRAVGDADVATEHEITVIRNRQEKTFKVVLGDFDEINKTKKSGDKNNKKMVNILGMSLIDAQDSNNKLLPQGDSSDETIRGALVVNVAPDSSAGELGLIGGDIIEEVNQQLLYSAQDFVDAVKKSRKGNQKSIYIRVRREGTIRFLSLKIDEDENAVSESNADKLQSRGEDSSKEEKSQASPDQELPKKEENHSNLFERREKTQTFDLFRNFEGFMKKFEGLMRNFGRKGETVEQNNKRIYK